MRFHYGLGVPAIVLAGLSAALGGTDTISKGHAALLAGLASGFAVFVTGLKASTKWDTAKPGEHKHQAIAEAAENTLRYEIDHDELAKLRTKLDKLLAQREELVTEYSAPS
jgi:hypothetical protein